jgi:hypothetical protein
MNVENLPWRGLSPVHKNARLEAPHLVIEVIEAECLRVGKEVAKLSGPKPT